MSTPDHIVQDLIIFLDAMTNRASVEKTIVFKDLVMKTDTIEKSSQSSIHP